MSGFLRIVLCAVAALAIQGMAARAQQATLRPEDIGKIKAEINAAMSAYIDASNRGDSKFIGNSVFSNPSVALGPDGVATHTPDETDKRYANLNRTLVERGWVKSVTARYNICVLNANTGFVDAVFNRTRKDGSVIEPVASSYFFSRTKEGWKLSLMIGHVPTKIVSCSD